MAEHADGSIIVDTEIDTKGFAAGSSELQRAIKSLNNKIQALGPTFQKALSGNASALSNFEAKAATLENTISELEAQLKSLGEARVPTEDYQWLTTEIEKAKKQLMLLDEKQIKMEDMGVKKSSQAWKSLQYDIDLARRKIADYEEDQAHMRDSGKAFKLGTSTAEYSQLESALASAKSKLAEMQAQADEAKGSTDKFSAALNGVKSALTAIGKIGKKAFSGFISVIKKGISRVKQFSKASNGCNSSITKLGKKITGLGSMLKRMALRKIMSGILSSVKEGFGNLAQYSAQTNKDLSALKSGLTKLKNSFATAFSPILTVVTPALTKLINYLSTAITYIGKLFAALTGSTTFVKAKDVQEDYASSLEGTASAAKEAKRQLTGFDDLNVLSDSSSDPANGETSPSDMFEEVHIESSITDFIGRLKQAFVDGDYAGIGEAIGNGINTAIQKIKDFVNWDNVGGTITNFVDGVAEGFNSMIDTVDWNSIGNSFAEGFNTVLNTLFLVLTAFDWLGLAEGLANSINGFVNGVDWAIVGQTISAGFTGALHFILTALETFDWQAFGRAVATLVANIDWSDLFNTILSIVKEIFNGVLEFRQTLHDELPDDLRGVLSLVEAIGLAFAAWKISSAVLDCINSIVKLPTSITVGVTLAITGITLEAKGLSDAIQNELDGFNFAEIVSGALLGTGGAAILGSGIATWIESAFAGSAVDLAITQAGINLGVGTAGAAGAAIGAAVAGIIAGIPAYFVGIYDACVDGIDWLNSLLVGAGATAAGAGIGAIIGMCGGPIGAGIGALIGLAVGLVTDGIILIVQKWDVITNFLSDFFTVTIPNIWNGFVGWLKNIPAALGEFFGSLPGKISTWFSNLWQPIKDYDWKGLGNSIGTWCGNAIKDAIQFVTVSVPNFFTELWETIKNAFVTFFTVTLPKFFTETLPTAFQAVIDFVKGLPEKLWNAIKTGWNWLVNIGKSIIDGIWEGLQTVWQAIKNFVSGFVQGFKDALGIHSPSTVFAEIGRFLIEGLLQGIQNMWSSITSFFSNALSSLKQTISNAWAEIKQGAQTAWQGISSTVSNAWSGIKTGVSTACTAVKTTASNAWNSVKSATSTAWNAVKSGVSTAINGAKTAAATAWNSMKTTASTVSSSIRSTVSTAWNTVKSSISTAMNNAKTTASTAWNSIKSTASSVCSSVKSTVSSAWSNVKSSVSNAVNNIKSSASSAWNSVKSTVSSVNNSIKSTVSSAWTSMKSTISTKLSDIKSSATSTFTSLKNSATTWGKDVCQNMANGISKAKSTVESAVKGVADKIKSFLGFSEPEDGPLSNFHTYMPDMIDLMAYGIKQNQGKAIGAVSNMASAISGEIQNGDYAMGDIQIGNGASAALGDFSDKITNSFATLIDRLQAIANGVTFATPAIATGGVVPYSIAASNNADSTGVTNAIEASNDELASVVTQVVANATTNIVNAIQKYSGTTVNFDKDSMASSVIQEINRRTRASGSSPLVG